jgi:hypothetical protein
VVLNGKMNKQYLQGKKGPAGCFALTFKKDIFSSGARGAPKSRPYHLFAYQHLHGTATNRHLCVRVCV